MIEHIALFNQFTIQLILNILFISDKLSKVLIKTKY
jgi:hypothetical protein